MYNRYVISLAAAACIINIILSLMGATTLDVFFTATTVTYLVITMLFVFFSQRARRALNSVVAVFSGGFLVTVILKAAEVLAGR